MGKQILHFCSVFILIHSHLKNCGINTTIVFCGRKEKPPAPLGLLKTGSAGHCAVVHRILAFFFLSLYIGPGDYSVSRCEYGQLALKKKSFREQQATRIQRPTLPYLVLRRAQR